MSKDHSQSPDAAKSSPKFQFSFRTLLLVIFVAGVVAFCLREKPVPLSLTECLDYLESTRREGQVDRATLVAAYEDLISQRKKDPDIALAMSRLGRVYEVDLTDDETRGFVWDEDFAIVWYRKSFDTTTEPLKRAIAAVALAKRLRIRGASSDLVEARKALDSLTPDPQIDEVLELEQLLITITEKDFVAAEARCRTILKSDSAKGGTKMVAAKRIVEAWPQSTGSEAEKKAWITGFASQFPSISLLADTAAATIDEFGEASGRQDQDGFAIYSEGHEMPPDLHDFLFADETYVFVSSPTALGRKQGCLWKINGIVQPSRDSLLVFTVAEPLGDQVEEALDITVVPR